jgi:2-polyprenyl-3-methyl-5-hydroxy-6-metoxy-1,4-benzoquinol methylase
MNCPVCLRGAAQARFVKNGCKIYECNECQFLFVHPSPSEDELRAFYEVRYRLCSDRFYPKAASRKRRALGRSLRFLLYVRGKQVLDIGCGGGFMVGAFKRLGAAEATGIDISAHSLEYARHHYPDCSFYCELLAEFARRKTKYDFVFSAETLEHLTCPLEFMEALREITVPGSFVYISTPDAGHPGVPKNLADWNDICPPEHLQFFNSRNLEDLFRRFHFELYRRHRSRSPAHSVIFRRKLT